MASSTISQANPSSPLKRSFDHALSSADSKAYYEDSEGKIQYVERRSLSLSTLTSLPNHRYTKRRTLSDPLTNSMLAQGTTIMSDSFPSFMSVYGNEETNLYNHAFPEHETKNQLDFPRLDTESNQLSIKSEPRLIERRGSITSATSYSTDSSPTTTSSTFDSPLMAEKSPDSSPESASSAAPPRSFQAPKMVSAGTQTIDFPEDQTSSSQLRQISTSPLLMEEPKRNLKKLTLDMKLPSLAQPAITSDPEALPFSAPTSPLREPLKTGRRKPNNLTIRTPGFNQLSFSNNPLAIPATPAQKPVLHQAQSSPSLPALASPTTGPAGGMRFNLPSIASNLRREPYSNNIATVLQTNLPILREEPYQPPQSQEAPEKGYTNGPCLIYDEGVYLYLEPTAEEAAKFDTVINVAKEIKNPFETSSNDSTTVMSVWRNAGNRQSIVEPQTAVSEISFKSAFEWPSNSGPATPTTPKAGSGSQIKRPEYLHVKWDHNSEILDDLLPLCRLVEERVKDGKKVLIHCQLGVSRSASLIIAYGLYKGYEKDFHSMYTTVKKRSQWVGPNMSLIYQLTDFKSKCDKGAYTGSTSQPKPEWFVYTTDSSATPTAGPKTTKEVKPIVRSESIQEPRPPLRLNKELPPVPISPQNGQELEHHNATFTTSQRQTVRRAPSVPYTREASATKAVPRALPFREMGYSNPRMVIPPHRPRVIPGLTFAQPSMDLAMQDVPTVPSLFSPRATEFMATPFGVTTAGDLVTSTPKTVKPPPGAFPGGKEWRNSLFLNQDMQLVSNAPVPTKVMRYDPRSPHQKSESREIFRNIDGFL